jgi:hypothetical protein
MTLRAGLQETDIFALLSDLLLELFARLFQPFDLFDNNLLI